MDNCLQFTTRLDDWETLQRSTLYFALRTQEAVDVFDSGSLGVTRAVEPPIVTIFIQFSGRASWWSRLEIPMDFRWSISILEVFNQGFTYNRIGSPNQ